MIDPFLQKTSHVKHEMPPFSLKQNPGLTQTVHNPCSTGVFRFVEPANTKKAWFYRIHFLIYTTGIWADFTFHL